MNTISSIIQGQESSLFDRTYSALQKRGVCQEDLNRFEKYRNADIEVLIDVCTDALTDCGYWEDK